MRPSLPAFEFRLRARKAMKPVLSVLVVVTLIAMLPSLISQTLVQLTDSDPSAAILALYTDERMADLQNPNVQVAANALLEIERGISTFFEQKWPFLALQLALTLFVSPVLMLGFNHALLKTLRREELTNTTGLERLPLFFKAIGLTLMLALRILLWMLPGMALALAGGVLIVFEPTIGLIIVLAALVLYFVLTTRAMYSYRLATYVMADLPDIGVLAAIRRSRDVMKGRRMELFSLEISFLGWALLLSLVQSMLLSMLGNVLGMTLGLFASFFLQLYFYMAEAAFYQEYAVGPVASAEAEPLTADQL